MLKNLCILSVLNIHSHWFLFMDSESLSYKTLNAKILVLSSCYSIGIISQILLSSKKNFFFLIASWNTRMPRKSWHLGVGSSLAKLLCASASKAQASFVRHSLCLTVGLNNVIPVSVCLYGGYYNLLADRTADLCHSGLRCTATWEKTGHLWQCNSLAARSWNEI